MPRFVRRLREAEIEQPEMADRIASILEEIRGGTVYRGEPKYTAHPARLPLRLRRAVPAGKACPRLRR